MDPKKILKKIKALLARADESRNDNAHEREVAMRQAQKMMDEHGVSVMEAEHGDGSERGRTGTMTTNPWKRWIATALGPLYGVTVYNEQNQMLVRVGSETNREIHKSMCEYVYRSIEREAKGLKGMGRKYINSFKNGASVSVCSKAKEMLAQRQEQPEGKGLMVLEYYKQELDKNYAFLAEDGIELRHRNHKGHVGDREGYNHGKEFGNGISLNDQIGGGANGGPKLLS